MTDVCLESQPKSLSSRQTKKNNKKKSQIVKKGKKAKTRSPDFTVT